ncbi:hypothetical protein ALP71_01597 [Pseudomonas coronafaciens pv. garcae]|nr:hypothetical protein ALP71_01597 [Pseudomonas coronafaciens pv. garcae]
MASFSSTLMVSKRSMERKINSLALRAARSAIFSMGCMDNSPKVVKESRAFYGLIRIISSLALLRLSTSCEFFCCRANDFRLRRLHGFVALGGPFL